MEAVPPFASYEMNSIAFEPLPYHGKGGKGPMRANPAHAAIARGVLPAGTLDAKVFPIKQFWGVRADGERELVIQGHNGSGNKHTFLLISDNVDYVSLRNQNDCYKFMDEQVPAGPARWGRQKLIKPRGSEPIGAARAAPAAGDAMRKKLLEEVREVVREEMEQLRAELKRAVNRLGRTVLECTDDVINAVKGGDDEEEEETEPISKRRRVHA